MNMSGITAEIAVNEVFCHIKDAYFNYCDLTLPKHKKCTRYFT